MCLKKALTAISELMHGAIFKCERFVHEASQASAQGIANADGVGFTLNKLTLFEDRYVGAKLRADHQRVRPGTACAAACGHAVGA